MIKYCICLPACHVTNKHANVLLKYLNINLKFQRSLQEIILGQRSSADKNVCEPLHYGTSFSIMDTCK